MRNWQIAAELTIPLRCTPAPESLLSGPSWYWWDPEASWTPGDAPPLGCLNTREHGTRSEPGRNIRTEGLSSPRGVQVRGKERGGWSQRYTVYQGICPEWREGIDNGWLMTRHNVTGRHVSVSQWQHGCARWKVALQQQTYSVRTFLRKSHASAAVERGAKLMLK